MIVLTAPFEPNSIRKDKKGKKKERERETVVPFCDFLCGVF